MRFSKHFMNLRNASSRRAGAFVLSLALACTAIVAMPEPVSAASRSKTAAPLYVTPVAISHSDMVQGEMVSGGGIDQAVAAGVFWVENTGADLKFVNCAHGYSVHIPKTMNVVDMSHSSLYSVLEDSHRHLEIYKSDVSVPLGYVGYGYKFLQNTTDHVKTYECVTTIGGRTAYIKEWQRAKFARIENDHNYYASVTLISGNTVLDFFFTSDVPFWQAGGFLDIVNSISFFQPTAKGLDIKTQSTTRAAWNVETARFYDQYFVSTASGLTWGMYNRFYPERTDDLEKKEEYMGYKFPIVLRYTAIHPENAYYVTSVGIVLDKAWKDGRATELTLQTPLDASGSNMMYQLLQGQYDTWLHDYAKMIAKFGHPVLFRPFNEMNGDWCNYSAYATSRDPMVYKEVYRYIYSIFEAEGANKNTIWVWNPNGISYPGYAWNDQRCYYPGDEFVDIMGLTRYNTGTFYSGETWKSFNTCYYDIYAHATALYNQPMMITEFACATCGGDKVAWVKNMFYYIKGYDRIKVAIWWDGCDFAADGRIARSYFIDDPAEVMDVFRNNIGNN